MLVFKPYENLLLPPKIFTTTTVTNSKPHHLHLHHHHHHDVKLHCSPLKPHYFKSITLSSSSSSSSSPLSSSPPSDSSSLTTTTTTVDFLMDSCGLSYEEAIQVIRKLPTTLLQDGGRKPRSVIAYFESIGLSKTHISKAISKFPRVLVSDVEKTLKPKIQMFQLDYGIPDSDIADLMSSNPTILRRSLKNQMKPALDFIKSFVKTNEELIKVIKRNGYLLRSTYRRNTIEANIHVLRQHGVRDSEILHLILLKMTTLMLTPKVFKSIVERIVSLGGFKPETRVFTTAVVVMCSMKKATWDSKIDLLKGLGWSDEQILDAFRRNPKLLSLSRENLKDGIEFFKQSLNWDTASVLSNYPIILTYSLKKRFIPRLAVLKCLMSNEIIKQDKQFISMLMLTETQFLSKYVFKYQEQLPYLCEVYKKECMLGCEKDNGDIDMRLFDGDAEG